MRLLAFLLALLGGWGSLTRIHDLNEAVQQAGNAYKAGQYGAAARLYKEAVRYNPSDEAILLNLGHASAQSRRLTEARAAYGRLLSSRNASVRSIAQQQLAVLASRRGDYVQALGLLRQALQANAANAGARYNYEVISDYLARRQTNPDIPPPATDDSPPSTDGQPNNDPNQPSQSRQPRAGQDQQGQLNDPAQRQDPRNAPQPRPGQQGQQDPNRPIDQTGSTANGNFQPGQGAERNVAQGTEPGTTRGLSNQPTGPQAGAGSSRQPGTEAAALDESQLQTQRARLQQMNLSSGQAQQVLDALSAAEQQYIQQLPRSSPNKPDPKKPAW